MNFPNAKTRTISVSAQCQWCSEWFEHYYSPSKNTRFCSKRCSTFARLQAIHGTYEERILANIDYDAVNGCWLWRGPMFKAGYGLIAYHQVWTGVHRVAWMEFRGHIPTGALVLHGCDVRPCCNPGHLRPGTYTENNRETVLRGRQKFYFGDEWRQFRVLN